MFMMPMPFMSRRRRTMTMMFLFATCQQYTQGQDNHGTQDLTLLHSYTSLDIYTDEKNKTVMRGSPIASPAAMLSPAALRSYGYGPSHHTASYTPFYYSDLS